MVLCLCLCFHLVFLLAYLLVKIAKPNSHIGSNMAGIFFLANWLGQMLYLGNHNHSVICEYSHAAADCWIFHSNWSTAVLKNGILILKSRIIRWVIYTISKHFWSFIVKVFLEMITMWSEIDLWWWFKGDQNIQFQSVSHWCVTHSKIFNIPYGVFDQFKLSKFATESKLL